MELKQQVEMHPQRWGDPASATDLPESARGLIEMAFGLDETPAESSVSLPAPALPEQVGGRLAAGAEPPGLVVGEHVLGACLLYTSDAADE